MAGNGGAAYTDAEIRSLIELIRQLEPISGQQWDIVVEGHAEEWGDRNRTAESLKKKFRALVNMRAPTGDPNIPEVVFLAKQINNRRHQLEATTLPTMKRTVARTNNDLLVVFQVCLLCQMTM